MNVTLSHMGSSNKISEIINIQFQSIDFNGHTVLDEEIEPTNETYCLDCGTTAYTHYLSCNDFSGINRQIAVLLKYGAFIEPCDSDDREYIDELLSDKMVGKPMTTETVNVIRSIICCRHPSIRNP